MATMTALPPPGSHGGDAAAMAGAMGLNIDQMLDLSQSLNPVAPDPVPVLGRHLESLRRYPDPTPATAALARAMGVDERHVLLTNGGSEAIALVSEEIGGRVAEPEFSLHPRHGSPWWRSNPHNPSGRLAAPDHHADVWDEAFYPLATGQWTRGGDDAIVVGSLTKLLGCPGLRIGYVLVSDSGVAVLDRCRRRQPLWAVNGLAVSALPELLAPVDLPAWSARVGTLRGDLEAVLRRHGLEPRPSDASWVLVESPGLRARLAPYGIVVRDCTSFGLPRMARIAVPTSQGLDRLDEALSSTERCDHRQPTGLEPLQSIDPGGSEHGQRKGIS